ncbi:hypothetical protein HOD41_08620 [bacterium]|jgi:hypothetical protein|nr:hypothetical protein [bacterium]
MKTINSIVLIILISLVLCVDTSALTMEVASDVTQTALWGEVTNFSLDGVMSEVTEVRLTAHIDIIELPTIYNYELNETLPWYVALSSIIWINSSRVLVSASQTFPPDSNGEYYVDIVFDGGSGYEFMTEVPEIQLLTFFDALLPGDPNWQIETYGEIYIDYIIVEIDGVLPTTQTSFGGMKALFR